MTDTFLDDQTTANLRDDLRSIARNHPELLRIARRETSPPGGKAHRNPNGYKSRPPVNIGALSTSHELHAVIAGWCQCLADDAHVDLPSTTDTGTLSTHLSRHTHQIAQQQWADDCADEMKHWARVLNGYTSTLSRWEGKELRWVDSNDLDTAAEDKFLTEEEVLLLHFHITGENINPSTLRSWRGNKIPDRRLSGAPVYSYPEVKRAAKDSPKPEGRHAQHA